MFKKAERKKAKLRLALMGPSGSGKTYSALQIAQGLGGKVAVIDTERGSADLYAHIMDYDTCTLTPPYTPQAYISAIKEAEAEGYEVLIVDSLSHAWTGEGGMLDMHDKATKASASKNSFDAWRSVTPWHNKLVDALLGCSSHVIITTRTKTAYELVEDDRGKKKPVKIGLAPVFRDGIEYEFTTVLDLSIDGHLATSSKDRTGLFDGVHETPSVDTGRKLITWLNSGSDISEPEKKEDIKSYNKTKNLSFLQAMTTEKKRLGEDVYYSILGGYGFEHADQIENREDQIKIYTYLKETK